MRTSLLRGMLAVALIGIACSDDTTAPVTSLTATLSGAKEVPPVSPAGTGTATCTIDDANSTFSCIVTYAGLTGNPTASHIHVGAPNANGNVRVNLCGAGAAPACPGATSGTITSGPQPATGDTFAAVAASMRAYGTYVNVHTAANTGGETRGQLQPVVP